MKVQGILDSAFPESVIGTDFLPANERRRIAARLREFSFEWKRQTPFASKEKIDLSVVIDML